jgi:lipoprotein signal peptidase
MRRNNKLLKLFLLFSFLSLFIHLYISFFSSESCTWNSGVAFGLMGFLSQRILSVIVLFFLVFVIYIFTRYYKKYYEILLVLLISSLGNVLDRIFHGGVCDYINLKFLGNFPVFNLNDIFILVSLSLIFFIIFYDSANCK